MRKRGKLSRILNLSISTCIMLVIGLSILSGCHQDNPPVKVPMEAKELSLVNMWDKAVSATGAQTQSAHLHSFQLWTDRIGKLYNVNFAFTALNDESSWILFWIHFKENGEIYYTADPITGSQNIELTYNPGTLFSEIDKVGLTSILSTCSEFSIDVQPARYYLPPDNDGQGYYEYSATQTQLLYDLADGKLTPLSYVKYDDTQPYRSVRINKTLPGTITGALATTPYYPPEIWFLSTDLDKAEMVEYPEN